LESRKVQKVGYSTMTVSLPRRWIKRNNVKPGDFVFILQEVDGTLRILPSGLARREEAKEYIINADECDEEGLLERLIVGGYMLGLDVIRITSANRIKSEHAKEVRGIVQKLIGLGILEETAKHILLQCSIDPTKFQLDMLIRRLSLIASTMYSDAMQALLERNTALATDAIDREGEANKIYFLATRLLVLAQRRQDIAQEIGLNKLVLIPCTCLLLQYLELIADYSRDIAKHVIELLEKYEALLTKKTLEKIYHLSELTQNIFQKAVDCIFLRDLKIANDLLEMSRVLESEFEREMHEAPEVPYLRTIISTLSKIADKGTTIANLAINAALMRANKEIGKIVKIERHTQITPLPPANRK